VQLLLVILLCVAVYRVTRLVVEDAFPPIAVPREWLLNWWQPDDDWIVAKKRDGSWKHPDAKPHWGSFGGSLRYLFSCPWCMSVWVGAAMVWGTDQLILSVPYPWLTWAASSAVTGLLFGLEEKLS
jgi:hypothetical protein